MHPKITIITPSYNQAEFLEETIKSVISQNYPNLEYIVIDGASTDNSVEIIRKYQSGISFWKSEKDNGQAHAINKGLKIASGEIVGWINSDDILMPWTLQEVAEYFNQNPSVSVVNGYTLRINADSQILFNHFVPKQYKWFIRHGIYYINQPSMFWRRKIHDDIGYLYENLHARMDQEFVIRMLKNNVKFGIAKEIWAAIRIHENTKTSLNSKIWEEDLSYLKNLYSVDCKFKSDLIGTLAYRLFKIFNLNYIQQYRYSNKWKGYKVDSYVEHKMGK